MTKTLSIVTLTGDDIRSYEDSETCQHYRDHSESLITQIGLNPSGDPDIDNRL